MILKRGSLELLHGKAEAFSFLVDMNRVYEHFVVGILREALALDRRHWVHHPRGLRLDDVGAFGLHPDVLWRASDRTPRLVLDVKYKETTQGEGSDMYQMLAYCSSLGLQDGVLVYANARRSTVHRVSSTGCRIHVLGLDPDGSPDELRERARKLADYLGKVAANPSEAAYLA